MKSLLLFDRFLGILMLVTGFILHYIINRRRFNRRAITGLQLFRSYEHSLIIRFLEGIGRLVAAGLIIIGLMVIVVSVMAK